MSFLLLGVDLETIAKGAGISIEEVIKIKEEMQNNERGCGTK